MKEIKQVKGKEVLDELLKGNYIRNDLNYTILKLENNQLMSATLRNKKWNVFHTQISALLEGKYTVVTDPFKTIKDISINDDYWIITIDGKIIKKNWQGNQEDVDTREAGNAFINRVNAEKELQLRKNNMQKRIKGELV